MDTQVGIPSNLKKLYGDWLIHLRSSDPESANQIKNQILEQLDEKQPDITYLLLNARHHTLAKDFDEAKVTLGKLSKESSKLTTEQKYYYYLFNGDYFYSINHYDKALHSYIEAGSYLNQIDDEIEHADYHYRIGTVYFQLRYASSSVSHAENAYKIFNKYDEYKKRANDSKVLLAESYKDLRNYKLASSLYEEVVDFCKEFNNPVFSSGVYRNLGMLYSIQGQSQDAIEQFRNSINGYIKDENLLPSYFLLSQELFIVGEPNEGMEVLNQGLALASKIDKKEFKFRFLILEGKYIKKEKEEENYIAGISYFKEKKLYDLVERYSNELADYYFVNGEYKRAGEYYRLAKEARDRFSMRSKIY